MNLEELNDDYNWQQAWAYAPNDCPMTSVVEILASDDGENDGDPWIGLFRLADGRILYLEAGCDYTGWDCRAGGHGDTRLTLEEAIRELCSNDDRKRLKLSL